MPVQAELIVVKETVAWAESEGALAEVLRVVGAGVGVGVIDELEVEEEPPTRPPTTPPTTPVAAPATVPTRLVAVSTTDDAAAVAMLTSLQTATPLARSVATDVRLK